MNNLLKTVGFIGTGLMGLPMAKNILKKKFKLHVCNRTPAKTSELKEKGAKVLNEPRIGAHGTLVIFVHPKDSSGVLIELMEPTR